MWLEIPLIVLLVATDSLDIDELLAIMHKRRDALFIDAGVEHRKAANEGNWRESPSRFAWIAPFCGLDGIGPVPHLRFGTRRSFDELSNPLFGYDPRTSGSHGGNLRVK